jgi:hypothetical protein
MKDDGIGLKVGIAIALAVAAVAIAYLVLGFPVGEPGMTPPPGPPVATTPAR